MDDNELLNKIELELFGRILPTCRHLSIRPEQHIRQIMRGLKKTRHIQNPKDVDVFHEWLQGVIGIIMNENVWQIRVCAWCKKFNCVCPMIGDTLIDEYIELDILLDRLMNNQRQLSECPNKTKTPAISLAQWVLCQIDLT